MAVLKQFKIQSILSDLYNNIANCYVVQGLYGKGFINYMASIHHNKDQKNAMIFSYIGIAEIFMKTNKFNEALEYAKKRIQLI